MRDSQRIFHLLFGIVLCAIGIFLGVRANIGLTPWDAFAMGLANLTGISFAMANISIGITVIVIDLLLHETIGFGTIINTLGIGWLLAIFDRFVPLPMVQSMSIGLPMLLIGQLFGAVGTYYYISSALGCGPRDTLMVALGKRSPKAPIGVIRGLIEAVVLLIGWLLGAKVGIGTVISVFGISILIQMVFRFYHFHVRSLVHESIFDTCHRLFPLPQPTAAAEREDEG